MRTENSDKNVLYLYGIVHGSDASAMGAMHAMGIEVKGVAGDVYPVVEGDVGALVSALPAQRRILPVRKNLEAQNRVLRELAKVRGGVLPMRFGHLVPGERDVRRMLAERHADILTELGHLDGRTEMALAVSWEVDNVFGHLTARHDELEAARDAMFAGGREPSRDELCDLGHTFARILAEERARLTAQVIEALAGHVVEIEEDTPRAEKVVMSLALLVEREKLDALDARVQEIAAGLSDDLLVKYTGPFVPFHFVGLDLDGGAPSGDEVPS